MNGFADLHTHTRASDGMSTPTDNIRRAKENGLAAVAITDHDTVDGVEEALAAGRELELHVVPGVEISTTARKPDIHVLGYYVDWRNPLFAERLASLRNVRERRNELLIGRLQELGVRVTMEEVVRTAREQGKTDGAMGRPHIADWMVRNGYAASMEECFERYLGSGGKAYVSTPRIHPREAVQWIHEAGGSAVLAHPGLYEDDDLIGELAAHGLDGLEVWHPDHSPDMERHYDAVARRCKLIATAGSDYHGERGGVVFHGDIGSKKVAASVLHRLRRSGK